MDFVELCGSELAAGVLQANQSKQTEQLKKFATHSFNSLSMMMTKMTNQLNEHHSLLTQVLCGQMDPKKSKIILCCSVSPSASQYRHSLTALKFTSKIREVIVKKLQKER